MKIFTNLVFTDSVLKRKFQISEKLDKKNKRPVKLPNGADAIEVDMEGKFGPTMDSLHEEISTRRVPAPTRFRSKVFTD